MNQLPQGWTKEKLSDVAEVQMGQSPKGEFVNQDGEGIHFYQGKAEFGKLYPTPKKACTKPTRIAQRNDILISIRAPVGPTNYCPEESCIGRGLAGIRAKDGLNQHYLLHYLRFIEPWMSQQGTGSTFKAISGKFLKDVEVLLAPEKDQKRIADKLDSVLAKVETAQARLDKIPTILKRFRQSVLAAATSGELTKDWREENESIQSAFEAYELKRLSDRKKWEEIKLSEFREKNKFPSNDKWKAKYKEVALPNQEELQPLNSGWGYFYVENVASSAKYSMSSGPFGSALGRKDYTEAGVPVLRGQNVKNGVAGVGGFVFVSEEKATSIPRSLAYPGDVVVVAVGSSGVTGIIPQNISVALLSQNCNKISVDNVLVRSEYFNLFLQSQVAQSQISAQTTDTVRQFFSLTNLKKTVIAVPPLQEQNEILLRVEELFEHANTVEKQYNAAKARLDKLTQSILAKAFRGELIK